MTLPHLTPGFGSQMVDANGNPVYSQQPISSANEPLSPQQTLMPLGMRPNMPAGATMINTLGNTPTTDSDTALQGIVEDQARHVELVMQQMQQMQTGIEKATKEQTTAISGLGGHNEKMLLAQAEIVEILSQIKGELHAQNTAPGQPGAPTSGGPRPADEGQVPQTSASAPRVEGVSTGHRRFHTMPQGTTQGPEGGRHELADPKEMHGRHEAPEPPPKPEDDSAEEPKGITGMHYREAQHNYSIPNIARKAAGKAAGKLTDLQTKKYEKRTVDGVEKVFKPGTDEEVGAAGKATQAVAGHLGQAAEHFATTGEAGALLGGLEGPIGVAALVGGTVAHKALDVAQNERQKNLFYQQISGGSNLTSGVEGRAREGAFAYRNMFTMSGSESRDLYKGVSALAPGNTQASAATRDAGLDFAMKQYKQLGLSVTDSLGLISTSIKHGVDEFGTLNTAIDSVSKTAREAGENSQDAIEKFSQVYGQVLGNVTNSAPAATEISSGLTNLSTTLGKQLNLQPSNFTGMLQGQGLYQAASAAGIDPVKAEAQVAAGGPDAAKTVGQLTDAQYKQFYDHIGGQSATQEAIQYGQQIGVKDGVATEDQQTKIGEDLVSKGITPPLSALVGVAQALNMGQMSEATLEQLAGRLALSGGDIGATKALDQASQKNVITQPGKIGGQSIITTAQVKAGKGGGTSNISAAQQGGRAGPTPQDEQEATLEKTVGTSSAAKSYVQMVQDTGKRSSLAENVLSNSGSYKNKKFVVDTADGEKQVDYTTLFTHYKDQLKAGTVKDASTDESLADETGVAGDSKTKITSSKRKAPKGAKGFDASDAKGVVTIKPTAALQKWFDFTASGGATVEQSQRAGVPASAFPSSPDEYSSASGN